MDRARRTPERRGGRQNQPTRIDDDRLRRFGLLVLCVKLGLVPLVFDPSADVPFVLPKVLLSHGLTYVLLAVLVGLVVLNGRSALVWTRVHVAVITYLGVNVLAAAFAVDHTLALFGTHVRMLGLVSIVDGVVTFLAAAQFVRTRVDVAAVALALLLPTIPVILYEIVQLIGRDPLTWSIDGTQRPFSTVGQPTTLGLYLVTLSTVAFGIALVLPAVGRALRVALLVHAGILLLASGLTGTRSVVIGAVAALGMFVLLLIIRSQGERARALTALGGVGAAALLGAVVIVTPVGGRLLGTVETPGGASPDDPFAQLEESTAARIGIYRMALGMLLERPLLGYGPDNFAAGVPAHRPEPAPLEIRQSVGTSAHSWIAVIGASSGILGLAAFGSILVLVMAGLLRLPFRSVATVGAIAGVAYLGAGLPTVSAIETDALFWTATAAVAGATARGSRGVEEDPANAQRSRRRDRPAGQRGWAAWGLVALSLLMMVSGITALGASRLAKESVGLRTPSTAAQAIDAARQATEADPRRAEYWQQLALAYVAAARWADASRAFQRAAQAAPYAIRFLTDDIQVQFALANGGDSQALSRAWDLAERAVRIDPRNPSAHLSRALVASARRDPKEAAASITRAVELDRNSTSVQLYVTALDSYLAADRIDDAIRVGRDGLAILGPSKNSVPVRVKLAQALVAGHQERDAVAQLTIALSITPGDQSATQLLSQIPSAAQVTNDAAAVSVAPTVTDRGGPIMVSWTGVDRPTIGDWVGLFRADVPDSSYVAWHLTTAEPSGSLTITVPATVEPGAFDVRLFLNYANTSVAKSDRIAVR